MRTTLNCLSYRLEGFSGETFLTSNLNWDMDNFNMLPPWDYFILQYRSR